MTEHMFYEGEIMSFAVEMDKVDAIYNDAFIRLRDTVSVMLQEMATPHPDGIDDPQINSNHIVAILAALRANAMKLEEVFATQAIADGLIEGVLSEA